MKTETFFFGNQKIHLVIFLEVKKAIETRRAYRALEPIDITDELIRDLASSAQLAPSCFNYQPWRYVFVRDAKTLTKIFEFMSSNNEWTRAASMIIAVYSEKSLDCTLPGRDYFLFDTGMATAFIILRATEKGLVAHPIAGYKHDEVKGLLGIPREMTLITLVIVGKHSATATTLLTDKQVQIEKHRPIRKDLGEFVQII